MIDMHKVYMELTKTKLFQTQMIMTAVCLEDVINGKKQILHTSIASIALALPLTFLLYWMIDGIVLITVIC
jgi:hypothetical protein